MANLLMLIEEIVFLADDCRYTVAHEMYLDFQTKLPTASLEIQEQCNMLLEIHCNTIDLMIERAKETNDMLNFEDSEENWILGFLRYSVLKYWQLLTTL